MCDAGAADVDLAGDSRGYRFQAVGQHVHGGVRDGSTERYEPVRVQVRDQLPGVADRDLRRAVLGGNCLSAQLLPALGQRYGERVAGRDHQAGEVSRLLGVEVQAEHVQVAGGHLEEAVRCALRQQSAEVRRVEWVGQQV